MKTIKWIIFTLLLAVGVYFILMETLKVAPTPEEQQNQSGIEIRKSFDKKGRLQADVQLIKGVRQGVGHNYYPNGSIHSEIYYNEGVKDGISTWFYEDGKPYRVTPYVKGQKHGIQRKYYENGNVMAEIPYEKNELVVGTKEYTSSGEQIDKYPYLIINQLDLTVTQGRYCFDIKLSEPIEKVDYYLITQEEGKTVKIHPSLIENGINRISLISKAGAGQKQKVQIFAEFKSVKGNPVLISKTLEVETGKP